MATLVTGATRGIGLGLVAALAQEGAQVIGTHRGTPPAVAGVAWQPLDLADPDGPGRLAQRLDGVALDLLVCNAGVYPDKGQTLEAGHDAAMWAEAFAVNVTGVFLTIQALLPNLRAAQAPRVAIIASQMGSSERARGGAFVYRASKAAAINLGRNLAVDLAPQGIAVGIYHPGWVRTDMGGAGADIDTATAVSGLRRRFAALSLATTGCFLSHDGTELPF
ncbi:SDR family NAD(P)-dependent oxidoreductase [Rhodobaculum claviforme]|uniref:Short-chain dehydrogenase n=1 Tax=Rhodobaculum claviforme TaxID=1549854 RepID=A0A934TIN4_9RHOB|nr:short-chain dehydrogenase [Rhodobaculum claviforme]